MGNQQTIANKLCKASAYKRFDGSIDLFEACWRKALAFERDSEIDDLDALLDQFASEMVNNPRSRFYMLG